MELKDIGLDGGDVLAFVECAVFVVFGFGQSKQADVEKEDLGKQ